MSKQHNPLPLRWIVHNDTAWAGGPMSRRMRAQVRRATPLLTWVANLALDGEHTLELRKDHLGIPVAIVETTARDGLQVRFTAEQPVRIAARDDSSEVRVQVRIGKDWIHADYPVRRKDSPERVRRSIIGVVVSALWQTKGVEDVTMSSLWADAEFWGATFSSGYAWCSVEANLNGPLNPHAVQPVSAVVDRTSGPADAALRALNPAEVMSDMLYEAQLRTARLFGEHTTPVTVTADEAIHTLVALQGALRAAITDMSRAGLPTQALRDQYATTGATRFRPDLPLNVTGSVPTPRWAPPSASPAEPAA